MEKPFLFDCCLLFAIGRWLREKPERSEYVLFKLIGIAEPQQKLCHYDVDGHGEIHKIKLF